jgi:hypothetical protein
VNKNKEEEIVMLVVVVPLHKRKGKIEYRGDPVSPGQQQNE